MSINEFNAMSHHANMWVIHQGQKYYVISANFDQALFGLVDEKNGGIPAEEWIWVRCENVTLIQ